MLNQLDTPVVVFSKISGPLRQFRRCVEEKNIWSGGDSKRCPPAYPNTY